MKTDPHWAKIGRRPHHGILVPLFSLRTEKDSGIGTFLDLLPLIDWCHEVGFDTIQLLPLNDTGTDPSPYNPLSSCALNPIYLSLPPTSQTSGANAPLSRLSYSEVRKAKLTQLRHLFAKTPRPNHDAFVQKHPWALPYALFKVLKEEHGGNSWRQWPEEDRRPRLELYEQKKEAIAFQLYLQHLCFSQMEEVHAYAAKKGIFLKGDLPILISPDSADVWAEPSLFRLDLSAGAPPDYYNRLGQKWGFPLFNWEAMRQTHFAWWKRRFKAIESLYDIYRIDHIVGFFRIWGIPFDKKPIEGSFFPTDTALWPTQGRELLEMMIDSSPLLPMGEDLGTIPKEVYPILKELGICGVKVLRWQKRGDGTYPLPTEYEPYSLTTLSTPDMDPLQAWWQKFPEEAIPFAHFKQWSYQPLITFEQRLAILQDTHATASYFHINMLQEYLALFPELVSENPEDERINIPGTLLPTNWTYRFRPTLETIASHGGLREAIRELLTH